MIEIEFEEIIKSSGSLRCCTLHNPVLLIKNGYAVVTEKFTECIW